MGNPAMGVAYGVDLGGTTIRAAIVDTTWQVRWQADTATPRKQGPAATLDRVIALMHEAPGDLTAHVCGAGVGLPGLVDPEAGLAGTAANLPGWDGFPVRAYLRERLGLPVSIDHDLRAVTRGEMRCGAARGLRDFALVAVGTGVGLCLVIDGHIYRRSTGDLGHMTIDPNGRPCPCGNVGCLERYVSGTAIENAVRAAVADGTLDRPVSPEALAAMATSGHPWARAVFDQAGRYLGFGLLNVAAIVNPEVFIIGGGLARAGELLLGPAVAVLEKHAVMFPDARARIRTAQLGDMAGPVGAASLVMSQEH